MSRNEENRSCVESDQYCNDGTILEVVFAKMQKSVFTNFVTL